MKQNGIIRRITNVTLPLLLFIFLQIFTATLPAVAQQIKCDFCNNPITGKYYRIKDKAICENCFKSSHKCRTCGIPVKDWIDVDGEKICNNCYNKRLPRCTNCGKPMFRYWNHRDENGNNQSLCTSCTGAKAPRCGLCGKSLMEKYWTMKSSATGEEKIYCTSCKDSSGKCFACGLPVKPGTVRFPDGRQICPSCSQTAVRTRSRYEGIFRQVRSDMNRIGLTFSHQPEIHMVDSLTLERLSPYKNIREEGLYLCKKIYRPGGTDWRIEKADIYILSYLPANRAYQIMAHECGHAWYHERVLKEGTPEITEGFSEWTAYTLLMKKNLTQMARTMLLRNDVYGNGLKRMLDYQKRYDTPRMLQYVISEK